MHVLITVNAAWNVRNFRWPIVRDLLARGYRVTVLAPPDASVPAMEADGVRFIPLTMAQASLSPLDSLNLLRQFHRHFGAERPDAVLSFTIKNNIFGAIAARLRGIPFIPNVSGLGTAFLSGSRVQKLAELLYRTAFRPLPCVFIQNAEDAALFVERRLVRAGQVRLLPGSGIDLEQFAPAPLPSGPPVFLMVARLLRDKGVVEYAEAARIVRTTHPDARFCLLGGMGHGNRTAISAAMLEEWIAAGHIEYLGEADDVRPAMRAAHCVVLPSYREGAPRTLLEGAAMARPVIATDVPGCRSVMNHGETGLLCEARSAQSLAQACSDFIARGPEQWAAMGAAGRAKMTAEFDQAIVVAAYREALAAATPA